MAFPLRLLGLACLVLLCLSSPSFGLSADENNSIRDMIEQWPILLQYGWQNDSSLACSQETKWRFIGCNSDEHVTSLVIENIPLNGHIPPSISRLNYLNKLTLSRTSLTGGIPHSMGDLLSLSSLVLSRNQLTGQIPESLGNLNALSLLSLDYNNFNATIPSSLGNLRSLDQLYLESAGLIGTIPDDLGSLSLLLVLYLDNNQLNGTIPSTLVELSSLAILSMKNNLLQGTIPLSLLELPALASLALSNNSLTGGWPDHPIGSPLNELFVDSNSLSLCPALQLRDAGHLDSCNITVQAIPSCGCHSDWVKTWCVPSAQTSFLPDCAPPPVTAPQSADSAQISTSCLAIFAFVASLAWLVL